MSEVRRTNQAKWKQFVSQPKDIAEKTRRFRS